MGRPALLFDMYGVLMRLPGPQHGAGILDAIGADARVWAVYEELRYRLDAALITETAYWQQIGERVRLGSVDSARAIEADYAGCLEADIGTVKHVLDLIGDGWKVGILSNIPPGLAARVRSKHGHWLEAFDAVTFSCDIGVAKPEQEAYEVAVDALQADPKGTVFFDDRPDYLAGAEAAGLKAVRFSGWDSVVSALGL